MNREEILSHVDHTLLKPEATWPQIQTLCDEAIANHTASVCINTCYVKQAVEYMAWFQPAWEKLSSDEQYVLQTFYADEDAQTSAVYAIADHFHIERSSAYKRKNRALAKFAILLFGKT